MITTYYFGGNYFTRLIESIKNSAERNCAKYELIIVNDSAHKSEEINIKKLIADSDINKLIDIVLINNDINYGVTKSREIGLKRVTGDIIHMIDQDDCISENYYSDIFGIISDKNPILVNNGYIINEKNVILKKNLFKYKNNKNLENKINNINTFLFGGCIIISPGMVLFHKSIYKKILEIYKIMVLLNETNNNVFDAIDDFYLYVFLINSKIKFKYINSYNFYYRIHNANQRNRKKSQIKFIKSSELLYEKRILEGKNYIKNKSNFILSVEDKKYLKTLFYIDSIIKYIKAIYF